MFAAAIKRDDAQFIASLAAIMLAPVAPVNQMMNRETMRQTIKNARELYSLARKVLDEPTPVSLGNIKPGESASIEIVQFDEILNLLRVINPISLVTGTKEKQNAALRLNEILEAIRKAEESKP